MVKKIADEIGQITPFRSKGHEAVAALIRTTSDVKRLYESLMSTRGITLQQYNVLRILRGAKAPVCTMDIGDRLLERTPGITRLLDRLEAKGLTKRSRNPEDRRQVMCSLTVSGRDVLAGLDAEVDRLDDDITLALAESEKANLVDLLDRVRNQLPTLD